jgi:hypothetical protein
MRHRFFTQIRVLTGMLVLMAPLACSISGNWQEEQIADAPRPGDLRAH